ncbi:PP2C family serine/threonine-protein phosphatase [Pseudomonas baetica]|uniref:PP2C family serine/threonine-protein phosphatase n=1 Tax=Pseudomonas baetica TaxID=674054 RepID=UPI00240623A7|nr:PP2C family serine/threonine-protein phosphatase [Pseudomonas baetica]
MGQRVTWESASAIAIGTSHTERGGVCQDRCSAKVVLQGARPWLAMFVADGAGSASHSEVGAQMAIDIANDFVLQLMTNPEFGLNDALAVEVVREIRSAIYATAEEEGRTARDYACTFLGLISSDLGTLVFQIGDGAVVLDVGNGLELAITPQSGEYANQTFFISDENALDSLVTRFYAGPAIQAAAFSDGVQRLALDLATNTPHKPFFAPFFNVLATISTEARDQIPGALAAFLSSDKVNSRTDDDKSMALAVLRG